MRVMTISAWLQAKKFKNLTGAEPPATILYHGHRVERFQSTGDKETVQVLFYTFPSELAHIDSLVQYADPGKYITFMTMTGYMSLPDATRQCVSAESPVYYMGGQIETVYRTSEHDQYVIGFTEPNMSARRVVGSEKIYYEEYQEAAVTADPQDLITIEGTAQDTSLDIARVNVSVEKNTKGFNYSATVTNAHSVDEALAMVRQAMDALAAEYGQAPNANA